MLGGANADLPSAGAIFFGDTAGTGCGDRILSRIGGELREGATTEALRGLDCARNFFAGNFAGLLSAADVVAEAFLATECSGNFAVCDFAGLLASLAAGTSRASLRIGLSNSDSFGLKDAAVGALLPIAVFG